jgi:3-isopropylmalate dehydratase small subunit
MEDADPSFPARVQEGDVIVAGRNFGCGSSREQAPLALKHAGVSAVVAGSFARIFYRNAVNVGLPVIICPEAASRVRPGDMVRIDLEAGRIVLGDGEGIDFAPMPAFLRAILQEGGLVPYTRSRLRPH